MTTQEIIKMIFEICVIPMLGVLTSFLVAFIKAKIQEFKANKETDLACKYADIIEEVVVNCVLATTQTYVETLKKENKFDLEAQKNALQMTYKAVLKLLSDDVKKYITEVFGDLETYLIQSIEATVNMTK